MKYVLYGQVFNEHPSRLISREVVTKLVEEARLSLQVSMEYGWYIYTL